MLTKISSLIIFLICFMSLGLFAETELRDYYKSKGGIVHERRGNLLIDLGGITSITDNDLINISKIKNLNRIALDKTSISDIGVGYLSNVNNLDSLHASFTRITGNGFKNFKDVKLTLLNLNNTLINDDGLKFISMLNSLEELSIGGTKISDIGLKQLSVMPNLHTLYINNTNITDGGLQYLAGIKNIKYVLVVGTKVTAKGIANLKRKIPHHCEIDNRLLSDAGLK